MSGRRPISGAQVRAIKARQAVLGLPDGDYRALLERLFGVRSCKALSSRQAHDLLAHLYGGPKRAPGPRPAPAAPRAKAPAVQDGKVERLASLPQRTLIDKLRQEVHWASADGYQQWLMASLGLSRVASARQAMRVIEGLKGLKAHGHAGA